MRFPRSNATLLVCLLALSPVLAQQQSPPQSSAPTSPKRDPQALAAVQLAITASGGANALASIQTVIATGGITPSSPQSWVTPGNFKWEDDLRGNKDEFRDEFLPATGTTQVFASGHGKPGFNNGKKFLARSAHMAYANPPFHLPGLLLYLEFSDPNWSIEFIETSASATGPIVHVRTSTRGGPVEDTISVQEWYLDGTTGLPVRVVHRLPTDNNVFDYMTTTLDYSVYKPVNSMAVPFVLTTSEDGKPISTATINSINFNVAVSNSDFDLSSGGLL
jgi:hypothetical protein